MWNDWNISLLQMVWIRTPRNSAFLAVIGPAAYKVLRNLVAPAKPGEKSYKDLVDKLTPFQPTAFGNGWINCFTNITTNTNTLFFLSTGTMGAAHSDN